MIDQSFTFGVKRRYSLKSFKFFFQLLQDSSFQFFDAFKLSINFFIDSASMLRKLFISSGWMKEWVEWNMQSYLLGMIEMHTVWNLSRENKNKSWFAKNIFREICKRKIVLAPINDLYFTSYVPFCSDVNFYLLKVCNYRPWNILDGCLSLVRYLHNMHVRACILRGSQDMAI